MTASPSFLHYCYEIIAIPTPPGHGDVKVNGDVPVPNIKSSHNKEEIGNISPGSAANGVNSHDNAPASMSHPSSQATESNEETMKRVRSGWTSENANAVTVGELYLMVRSSPLNRS